MSHPSPSPSPSIPSSSKDPSPISSETSVSTTGSASRARRRLRKPTTPIKSARLDPPTHHHVPTSLPARKPDPPRTRMTRAMAQIVSQATATVSVSSSPSGSPSAPVTAATVVLHLPTQPTPAPPPSDPAPSPGTLPSPNLGPTQPVPPEDIARDTVAMPTKVQTPPLSSVVSEGRHKRIPFTLVEASKGNRCPTAGCDGLGHITGRYAMHYAVSGCPIAARDSAQSTPRKEKRGMKRRKRAVMAPRRKARVSSSSPHPRLYNTRALTAAIGLTDLASGHSTPIEGSTPMELTPPTATPPNKTSPKLELPDPLLGLSSVKHKRIPFTLVEASKGNRCPTAGCDGLGHITGRYAMHYAVSGCPIARGLSAEQCRVRREELLLLKQDLPIELPFQEAGPGARSGVSTRHASQPQGSTLLAQPAPLQLFQPPPLKRARKAPAATPHKPNPLVSPDLARFNTLYSMLSTSSPFSPAPSCVGVRASRTVPQLEVSLFKEAQAAMRDRLDAEAPSGGYNLSAVTFGRFKVGTWYTSPYPSVYTQMSKLYICEFCLKHFRSIETLKKHTSCCQQRHPPGDEIYRKDSLSVFEVDGERHKLYCQNLCLLAKLFLDHKTLYFDVEPFLFYMFTMQDSSGCHLIGYFSKEKHSSQNYNLSCLLTLPQHMRKGFGRLMIDFSYLLTREEGRVGSPERPLSDLGLLSYRSYWLRVVVDGVGRVDPSRDMVSIKDLSVESGVTQDDIISTLQYYSLVKYWKGKHIVLRAKVLQLSQPKDSTSKKMAVDPTHLKWTPKSYPDYSL